MSLNESIVEDAALEWFGELGYAVGHGASFAKLRRSKLSLAPGGPAAERDPFGEMVLVGRLRETLRRVTPAIPSHTLAYLHDTLLPKLLRGELSVTKLDT
jgi:type I restriction enzyme R subunit